MVKSIPGQAKSLRSAEQGELDSRLRQCVDSTPCSTTGRYSFITDTTIQLIMAFFSLIRLYGSRKSPSRVLISALARHSPFGGVPGGF